MKPCQSDEELFALGKRELFTAVVGDVMDSMGLRHQFLSPQIQPLTDDMIVIGRAMPVVEADIEPLATEPDGRTEQPFGLMLRALDDLRPVAPLPITAGRSPS